MKNLFNYLYTRFNDTYLLRRSEKIVRRFTPAQHQKIRQLHGAAVARVAMADEVTELMYAPGVIGVYREAACLFIAAIRVAKEADLQEPLLELGPSAKKLEALVQSGALPALPNCHADAMSMLQMTPDTDFDRLAAMKLVQQRDAVESWLRWLRVQTEPRGIPTIRLTRALRVVVAIGVLLATIAQGVAYIRRPRNLALNRPVLTSSIYPGTSKPDGATDGQVLAPFQAHTKIEADPWIVVDLGKVREISQVKVYNRSDGLFDDALPLTLEFSNDNTDYRAVDRREEAFTDVNPWVFHTKTASARFIRIHGRPGGYVVVSEIEAYGR